MARIPIRVRGLLNNLVRSSTKPVAMSSDAGSRGCLASMVFCRRPSDLSFLNNPSGAVNLPTRSGGFHREVHRFQAKLILTSFPRSASMAWNGVCKWRASDLTAAFGVEATSRPTSAKAVRDPTRSSRVPKKGRGQKELRATRAGRALKRPLDCRFLTYLASVSARSFASLVSRNALNRTVFSSITRAASSCGLSAIRFI